MVIFHSSVNVYQRVISMSGGIPIIIVVDYPNDINIIAPSYPIMTHYGLVILLWHIVYHHSEKPSSLCHCHH